MKLSLVGFLYGDVVNLLLLVESVSTSRKGIFKILFTICCFVIGVCCDENIVYLADINLGFSYYCFKYFVFDVGYVEFGDGRTKG